MRVFITELREDSIFYDQRFQLIGEKAVLHDVSRTLRGGFYGGHVTVLTGPFSGRELSIVGFKYIEDKRNEDSDEP